MQVYSTNHKSENAGLEEAIFRGLPSDNGLYMPTSIGTFSDDFFAKIDKLSFREISYEVAKKLVGDSIPNSVLREIIEGAVNFDAPLVQVEDDTYCLELFHGPSHAFKDFGARFMARVMSHYLQKSQKEINILVATSGDTGGAVALGFLNQPGINVTILYPSGGVSNLQEKQLTTLGGNIQAIEIEANEIPIKKEELKLTVNSFHSFTYKQYNTNPDKLTDLCDSLKKSKFISKETSASNFKKVFSGYEIKSPITWTGNVSEFYYFIKLLYTKHKLVGDLRQNQWKVACKCFCRPNGDYFEHEGLRKNQAPKSTSLLLESIVSLLK